MQLSPIVTKPSQSYPRPQGRPDKVLHFGRSKSKVKLGAEGIYALLNVLLVVLCYYISFYPFGA